jgi:KaiC/GvpD/RAD55 family RecA-like ATPase
MLFKQVFNETKKYLASEIVLIMGPPKSGKSKFAKEFGYT